jgi:small subunit ribosomal protein S17
MYGKFVTRSIKYHVHDDNNSCNEGDIITIRETKPYSKTKKWELVEVIERAK